MRSNKSTKGNEMTKRIPAMTARKNFGELLESVYRRGDEIIIERAGKPMGVFIPMSQYQRLERQRTDALEKMEQLWVSVSPTEDSRKAEQEILEETEAVRQERTLDGLQSPLAAA
jgi:prevent-host-death family protein